MGNRRNQIVWECPECGYNSPRKRNVSRHIRLKHVEMKHACTDCNFRTKRKSTLALHMRQHSSASVGYFNCNPCKVQFQNKETLEQHLQDFHRKETTFKERQSKRAFGGQLREYSRTLRLKGADATCLNIVRDDFTNLCKRILAEEYKMFTLNIVMER